MKKKDLKTKEQKLEEVGEFYEDLTFREKIAILYPEYGGCELSVIEDVKCVVEKDIKLRFENSILLEYLISLKYFLLKSKEVFGQDYKGNLTTKILNDLIYDETINDSKIDLFKAKYYSELKRILKDELAFLEIPQLAWIDDYLNELENLIRTNDSCFLEYFDKIEVGNFFKVKYFSLDELFFKVVDTTLKNNKLLKESILKPNGVTSAPIIAEQIKEYKELMLSESEMDFFDMNEKELLEIKNEIFKEIADIDFYNTQSNYVKELFRFRFKNRNGFVSIMYDLFQIIKPNEFKSKKEVELLKEDTSTIVDSKYWTKHKGREVSKKLDVEMILS